MLSFAGEWAAIRAITGQHDLLYVAKYLPPCVNTKGKQL